MSVQPLTSSEEIGEVLELSRSGPILILKHSTRCPVSSFALQEFEAYAVEAEQRGVHCRVILVVENRPVSQDLADRLGVRHQSPQAILVKNGEAVWSDSHDRVNEENLKEAEARVTRSKAN